MLGFGVVLLLFGGTVSSLPAEMMMLLGDKTFNLTIDRKDKCKVHGDYLGKWFLLH